MKRFGFITAVALVSAGLASVAAYGDTINLTLTEATQSTAGGTIVDYDATVSAPLTNTGAEFLNGDNFTLPGPYTLDDSPFLNNFPLSLTPGMSYTGELFDVVVPAGETTGIYDGSFQILGGPTDMDVNTLASVNFALNVTPEPGSLLLLGTGLLGLVEVTRRRAQAGEVAQEN